jgi:hypothetical protein
VLHRLVGDGELTEVVSHHIGLDLNLVENLTVVHTDNRPDHLREDDHVTEVGLDALWLLAILRPGDTLLGGTQPLEESIVLALETVLETREKKEGGSRVSGLEARPARKPGQRDQRGLLPAPRENPERSVTLRAGLSVTGDGRERGRAP